tara:strand:+ start:168 stop:290 length:123 start_codon:yes stop_codon:yes gene_type:complete
MLVVEVVAQLMLLPLLPEELVVLAVVELEVLIQDLGLVEQ